MTARREARARFTGQAARVDVAPPELAIGRCIEVWCEDASGRERLPLGADWRSAWRRYRAGRDAWQAQSGLTSYSANRLLPSGSPWSVEYLIETARQAQAEQRLGRAGVTLGDLGALRDAAQRWLR